MHRCVTEFVLWDIHRKSCYRVRHNTIVLLFYLFYFLYFLPSVLWRCWLGGRKGILCVKTDWWGTGVVICWDRRADDLHMVLTNATATPSSLAPVKSRMVYLSGAGLPRLSWKRRALNGDRRCNSSSKGKKKVKVGFLYSATYMVDHEQRTL